MPDITLQWLTKLYRWRKLSNSSKFMQLISSGWDLNPGVSGSRTDCLNLGNVDILGQKIHCCEACSVHSRRLSSLPGLHALHASSFSQLWQLQMPPNLFKCFLASKITSSGDHCSRVSALATVIHGLQSKFFKYKRIETASRCELES